MTLTIVRAAQAQALGVPRGPAYAKLVAGESVLSSSGNSVTPEQVHNLRIDRSPFIPCCQPALLATHESSVISLLSSSNTLTPDQVLAFSSNEPSLRGIPQEDVDECWAFVDGTRELASTQQAGLMGAFVSLRCRGLRRPSRWRWCCTYGDLVLHNFEWQTDCLIGMPRLRCWGHLRPARWRWCWTCRRPPSCRRCSHTPPCSAARRPASPVLSTPKRRTCWRRGG